VQELALPHAERRDHKNARHAARCEIYKGKARKKMKKVALNNNFQFDFI
jgi:hypothetical protein